MLHLSFLVIVGMLHPANRDSQALARLNHSTTKRHVRTIVVYPNEVLL